MTTTRTVHATLAVFALLGTACSSGSPTVSGTGGVASQGGTASGGLPATGGLMATGGTPSQGGTTPPATGGVIRTGGRVDLGSGGAGTGGGLGTGGTLTPGSGGVSTGTGGTTPVTSGGTVGSGGVTVPGSGGVIGPRSGGATNPASDASVPPGTGGTSGADAGAGVAQSAGCGKAKTLQNGNLTITSGGASRKYILNVPANYDNSHAYRLVFAFAESGSSAQSVATRNYFTMATLDTGKTTIFVAPDAANGAGSWSKTDVDLTDAILAQLEADLCIDKTRIFATGFSFGGAMSLALACTRADVFRGVAFFSGADLTGSCPTTLTKPIAYYASQASQDSTGAPSPTSGRTFQAKFAELNGCTADANAINFPAAGQPHTCTTYKNCSAGHPTVYCVFDGPHGWEPKDPGQNTSWDAPEAWKFITQF